MPEDVIDPEALDAMRERGGEWFAYRNEDIGHPDQGRLTFLKAGLGCTFEEPPEQAPDSPDIGFGWRYRLCGKVNTADGSIQALQA